MREVTLVAKSQLIKDLATNGISLEEGLQRLLVISSELKNEELTNWIIGELNGYSNKAELPDYRKNIGSNVVYSGLNGSFKVTNVTLPNHYFPKQFREVVSETPIRTNIRGIEKTLKEDGKIGMDLTDLAGAVYEETGIQCYKIFKEYSRLSLEEIISNVKNKLILLLLYLEREFGNLDDLDIDVGILTDDKTKKVKESVRKIFYDDMDENI